MANSSVIPDLKTNVIRAIINDKDIVAALAVPDSEEISDPEDLLFKYIFPYNKNTETITKVQTFITVMVHTKARGKDKTFVTPTLEIYIYSHNDHIEMNLRGIKDTRCDFLGKLIDEKFNNSTEYGGFGQLKLILNTEGTFSQKFLYRRLVFETIDLNDSLCDFE